MGALAASGITELLLAWGRGEDAAADQLAPKVYAELRRLASYHMRGERPGRTLQTTALVHEAYVRLVDARRVQWRDRVHFFSMASRLMRRVLVDAARARHSAKRGGDAARVSLDHALNLVDGSDIDLLDLDRALTSLTALDPRKGQVVELRFFGGLTIEETASMLNVADDTVVRDWDFARTWLKRQLSGDPAR